MDGLSLWVSDSVECHGFFHWVDTVLHADVYCMAGKVGENYIWRIARYGRMEEILFSRLHSECIGYMQDVIQS